MNNEEIIIHFDGSCNPNPGFMRAAIVVLRPNHEPEIIDQSLGDGTNNIAEWASALLALEVCASRGYKNVHLKGDSTLVVNQLTGKWRTRDQYLKKLRDRSSIVKSIFKLKTSWISRDINAAGHFFEYGRDYVIKHKKSYS